MVFMFLYKSLESVVVLCDIHIVKKKAFSALLYYLD